jgi:predicted RNase H-related nuclease YkuK (DUF458 family)
MLEDKTIRGFMGEEFSYSEFLKIVKDLDKDGYSTYVGTDSQKFKDKVSMVSCVCLYKQSVGSKIFYIKENMKKELIPTLRARILYEAYRSIEIAIEMDRQIYGQLVVHLDVGADAIKNKTARFEKELQILVRAQGFGCEIKPNSWASSSIADRFTKS